MSIGDDSGLLGLDGARVLKVQRHEWSGMGWNDCFFNASTRLRI